MLLFKLTHFHFPKLFSISEMDVDVIHFLDDSGPDIPLDSHERPVLAGHEQISAG